jgi:hypothetical protein
MTIGAICTRPQQFEEEIRRPGHRTVAATVGLRRMPRQHGCTDLAPEREGVLGASIGEPRRDAAIAPDPRPPAVDRTGMTVAKETPQQGPLLRRERFCPPSPSRHP